MIDAEGRPPEPEPEYIPEPEYVPEYYEPEPEYVAPQPECLIPVIPSLPQPGPILPIIPEPGPILPILPEPEPVPEVSTATNFSPFGNPLQLTNLPYNQNPRCNLGVLNSDYIYQGAPSFTYRAINSLRNIITTPLTPPEYQGDGFYTVRDNDGVYFTNRYDGVDSFPLDGWKPSSDLRDPLEDYTRNNCPTDITVPIFEAKTPVVVPPYIRDEVPRPYIYRERLPPFTI
jgi:hypothetical protein